MTDILKLSGKMREIPISHSGEEKEKDTNTNDVIILSISINERSYYKNCVMLNTVQELEQFKKDVIADIESIKLRHISSWK